MKSKPPIIEAEITIDSVGHKGDGVAMHAGRAVFVPLTAPGDRVRVRLEGERGELLEILAPSADRAPPPCRHFGACGGCALQHLAPSFYGEWKHAQVFNALAQRGFHDVAVEPAVVLPPRVRRRIVLKALRTATRVVLGFNRRVSHQLVDIAECVIASPALEAMFAPLRAVLASILRPKEWTKIALTESEAGLDCAFESETKLKLEALQTLARFAEEHDLARISWNGDPFAERRAPFITFEGVPVSLPPKHFLQASRAADHVLTERVLAGAGEARRIVDLFCGLGTFSIPLARRARVQAFDGDAAAIAALQTAARARTLPLEAERRDLFRRPLSAKELAAFDAAVFDPPRAGAREQCEAMAQSSIARIVAVSCSPASFARDARILVDGGFRLERVTPVDQFLWSPHVELTAVFSR